MFIGAIEHILASRAKRRFPYFLHDNEGGSVFRWSG